MPLPKSLMIIIGVSTAILASLWVTGFFKIAAVAGTMGAFAMVMGNAGDIADRVVEAESKTIRKRAYPQIFFHGTSRENAFEIYLNRYWMVGDSSPRGIYVTSVFDEAKTYAKSEGAILKLIIDPSIKLKPLKDRGDGYHVYEVPNVEAFQEYYFIPGIIPLEIFDTKGRRIDG